MIFLMKSYESMAWTGCSPWSPGARVDRRLCGEGSGEMGASEPPGRQRHSVGLMVTAPDGVHWNHQLPTNLRWEAEDSPGRSPLGGPVPPCCGPFAQNFGILQFCHGPRAGCAP